MLAIHPGEHLQEELEALSMSAAAFARQIDVPANRITQILKGERDITADTAMRIGHFFGTSAQFWMNLQSIYELRLAQARNGAAIKALPTLKNATSLDADFLIRLSRPERPPRFPWLAACGYTLNDAFASKPPSHTR